MNAAPGPVVLGVGSAVLGANRAGMEFARRGNGGFRSAWCTGVPPGTGSGPLTRGRNPSNLSTGGASPAGPLSSCAG
jgi:hypothetical protein